MLLDSWIPSGLIKGNAVLGVEAVINNENELSFNFVKLQKSGKSEFTLAEQHCDLSNEELLKKLKADQSPIVLCISGKDVLIKRSEIHTPLKDIFPNIQINEFYYQKIQKGNEYAHWSIIRKGIADKITGLLNDVKAHIVASYIGPSFILKVTDFVEMNESVQSNCYEIISQNEAISFKLNYIDYNDQLDFLNFKANNKSIVGILSGLLYFLNQNENTPTEQNTVFEEKQYFENRKFKLAGYVIISITLFLCLVNFIVFNNFFNEDKELKSRIAQIQSSDNNADSEIAKFKKQQSIFEETGLLNKNNFAFIADKIAATVKPDITLMSLDINPLEKQDSDTTISFTKGLVIITGKCERSISVNEWLNKLKTLSLVRDAKLDKFSTNNAEQGSNFEISLKISQ